MFTLAIVILPVFLNGLFALPLNDTEQELDAIRSIVNYFIENSETPNPNVDENLFEAAKKVHNCRKSLGINTPIGEDRASQGDPKADDFRHENNTETEKQIPTWPISPSVFDQFFDQARFDRYLTSIEDPSFKRRITWLYPDDGCWIRAELYSTLILKFLDEKYPNQSFEAPKKHFAFGDLWTKSKNAAPGAEEWIGWNYHVAPIVRLNDGKLYVFDPALGGNALPKEEWYTVMTQKPSSNISGFVSCEANTYSPSSSCFHPMKHTDEEIKCDNEYYLNLEWDRQIVLFRDPEKVLGEDTTYYQQG